MKKAAIAIAAILVVGGVGFTGWRQWQLRHERNTNSPPNQNLTNQKITQSTTQPPSDPSEGGKYLPVAEWGVKFRLGNTLKGAKYTYYDISVIYVTTPSVREIEGCSTASDMLSIQRAKKGEFIGPATVDDILAHNPGALTKLGDYYYTFMGSSYGCTNLSSQEEVKTLSDTKMEFNNAVKTVESIN